MRTLLLSFGVGALTLTGCGHGTPSSAASGKIDGPPVSTLSHEHLMAAYQDCTQYGQIDDPRVKYTVPYCAAVQSAQLSSGYLAPGSAKVDQTLNPMH